MIPIYFIPFLLATNTVGTLVLDGIPEIPARIAARTAQYQNARGAVFLDFAPDGRGMLIATRFADTMQVHFVAAPSAARTQLTFFREPVMNARFNPKVGTSGFYFTHDRGGGEKFQVSWFDRKTGRATLVTDGKSRNESLTVSNTGDAIAFTSTRRNGVDFDVYHLDRTTPHAEPKRVKKLKGQWTIVDFSPDDAHLLLKNYISINESSLHLLNVESGKISVVDPAGLQTKISYGEAAFGPEGVVFFASDEASEYRRLAAIDPKSHRKRVITPDLTWNVAHVVASPDRKWLAYVTNEGGMSALFVRATDKQDEPRRVELPKGVIGGLRFDGASTRLGFSMSAANSPWDAYSVDLSSLAVTRWTESEVGGLSPDRFVVPELISFESFDGRKIPAWVYRPRDGSPRDAAKKPHPVIIDIHGGPEAQSLAWFNPLTQFFVNELGAAVILPNVRGSDGYGKTYLTLDNAEKREDSVKDIGKLLDWVATQSDLDAKRVAVWGGSYGGYMVLASMIHFGDRLKCGAEIVGISNFVTFLENTAGYRRNLRRAEYGNESDSKMREILLSISPTTHAKKITKPLFVAQGLNDPRVPASEAEQIVKTVRENGGAVWYMLAKDEGHGFRKKKNRDAFINTLGLFFETHLLK
ncbi:MAG: alpha/beta fold hydrolase [Deltaproteobacteria bacterium]|nr:alpha/beta fold hydrolase [Deltaproteobacteria bacterium]